MEFNHLIYGVFEEPRLDAGWQNPRQDRTGGTAVERYAHVEETLRGQGRQIFKSVAKTLDELPRELIVGADDFKEREIQELVIGLAAAEGIIFERKETTQAKMIERGYSPRYYEEVV